MNAACPLHSPNESILLRVSTTHHTQCAQLSSIECKNPEWRANRHIRASANLHSPVRLALSNRPNGSLKQTKEQFQERNSHHISPVTTSHLPASSNLLPLYERVSSVLLGKQTTSQSVISEHSHYNSHVASSQHPVSTIIHTQF